MAAIAMDHLDQLENRSVHILREAYANFKNLGMLWSIGKDSTVLLWLARKAFFGHVPIPLVHIDTSYKIPEMIEYRDRLALEWNLTMIVGQNREALADKRTFPDGAIDRIACCKALKTDALKHTLSGEWPRYRLNHSKKAYELDRNTEAFTGVIVGARADEEGSRSKERYFSPRNAQSRWDVGDQPPEFWNQYKTDFAPGTHLRIHPLLDWTELNIWEYIRRENIPTVSLYYDQGTGKRYRSLGCWPCTHAVDSDAAQRGRHHPGAAVGQVREHRGALGTGAGQGGRRRAGDAAARRVHVSRAMLPNFLRHRRSQGRNHGPVLVSGGAPGGLHEPGQGDQLLRLRGGRPGQAGLRRSRRPSVPGEDDRRLRGAVRGRRRRSGGGRGLTDLPGVPPGAGPHPGDCSRTSGSSAVSATRWSAPTPTT